MLRHLVSLLHYLAFMLTYFKTSARQNGYEVEPSQELVALGKLAELLASSTYLHADCCQSLLIGMCNLASSFVGSYPVTGSFSRFVWSQIKSECVSGNRVSQTVCTCIHICYMIFFMYLQDCC